MSTKNKKLPLPFNALAVALLIEKHKPVREMYEALHFKVGGTFGSTLSNEILTTGVNGKCKQALCKVLRQVEASEHLGFENSYLNQLDKAKELLKKDKEGGFSIEINGAGTKENMIDALKGIIAVIESRTIEELENGFEDEGATLIFTTDTFESYTGYPIEEEKNQ